MPGRSRRPPPLVVAWAVLVWVLAVRAFAAGLLPPPPGPSVRPCRLAVNRAGFAELQALPGIGPSRAEAIVLERIRRGPFADLEDLGRVHGLGPEVLRELAPHVTFEVVDPCAAPR